MMIDTKKEQERDELHRAIWAIADELRGAVDGWDLKTSPTTSMPVNRKPEVATLAMQR